MMKSLKRPTALVGLAALMMACGAARAADPVNADPRVPQFPTKVVKVGAHSGPVMNNAKAEQVVWSQVVSVPGATSLRLKLSDVKLAGSDDLATTSYVRITNLTEKTVQFFNARSLEQWGNKSAYFNGDSVKVEIISKPGTGASQVTIDEVYAGMGGNGGISSQCGPTEDRVASSDVRVGRMVTSPTGALICTAWLIDDANHMLLSAGHCGVLASDIIEFNCPPSTAGGAIVHPGPEDQYPVDGVSRQTVNTGVGNDWSYFGCFPNSNTGLTPYQAQADFFTLVTPPAPANQDTRVTGFGIHPTPVLDGAQHTDDGPYMFKVGNEVGYQVDTDNGDSGSPVFFDGTGDAFAIHTNAGCTNPVGGSHNSATAINNVNLQNALNSPLGICAPLGVADPTGPLYFAGDAVFRTFGTVNRDTGLYGAIGPATSSTNFDGWQGLAYDRVANKMYATAWVSGTVRLYTVNMETGQVSFIGPTNDSGGNNIFMEGLAFDPNSGTLYGYSQNTSTLHVINKATGAVSNIGGAQAGVTISGIDYDPIGDKLYGIDDAPAAGSRLVTISTANGTVLPVNGTTTLGVGESDCDSLAYSPDDRYCYTVNQATNQLIRIDPATGLGVIIGGLDQPNSDGGLASVCGDCGRPIQPGPVNPLDGATGVSVNLSSLDWVSVDSEYCGSTQVPGSLSTTNISTPFRGHFFEIYTAQTMTEIKADLQFAGNKSITWACYEFEEGSGTGTLIFADTQTETGNGTRQQHTSGEISIPMKAGHWYAAGWHYGAGNDVTFFRDQPIPAGNTGAYGLFQGGCATNSFGAALPATTTFTTLTGAPQTTRYAMEYCFDPRCFNPAPTATDVFAAANVLRGNVVRMDQNKTLTEIEAELNFAGAQTITFVVYEGGDLSTPGELLFSKAVNLNGTGKKLYSSGAINVDLRADRTYAIGFHKTGNASYYRDVVASVPIDFQYGTVEAGFGVDGVAAVPATAKLDYTLPESIYDINMCFGPAEDVLTEGDLNTDVAATVGNLLRGTVINCEKDTVLDEIYMRLNLPSPEQVTFVVYEATASGGIGNQLLAKTGNYPGAGEAWYTSGAVNVPMEAGKVYMIGIHKVSTNITYFFENTTDYVKFYDFGTVLGGFTQNGFPTVPNTITMTPDVDTIYTMRMFYSCETWYEVFFGTAANPPKIARTVSTLQSLSTFLPLNSLTTYFWRIQAHNCCGFRNSDGPFDFTTEGDCYPDCDQDGALTIDDFICFQTFFALNDKYADCDKDGVLTIDDFICFQTFFAIGC